MALLAVFYGIGGTAVSGRALGDGVTCGQHNAVLIEGLAIQHRALIIGPGTQVIRRGGQHAAFIAPSGVGANEGAAINLEQVGGKVKGQLDVVFECNTNSVLITRIVALSDIIGSFGKFLSAGKDLINIGGICIIVTAIKVAAVDGYVAAAVLCTHEQTVGVYRDSCKSVFFEGTVFNDQFTIGAEDSHRGNAFQIDRAVTADDEFGTLFDPNKRIARGILVNSEGFTIQIQILSL